jgi:hypothetical protein
MNGDEHREKYSASSWISPSNWLRAKKDYWDAKQVAYQVQHMVSKCQD